MGHPELLGYPSKIETGESLASANRGNQERAKGGLLVAAGSLDDHGENAGLVAGHLQRYMAVDGDFSLD